MAAYLVRRVLMMVMLLFLLSITVFALFNALPSDPARLTCGKVCTPALLEANRRRLGYDKPLLEQYEIFVSGIFTGREFSSSSPKPIQCPPPCLGYSYSRHQLVLDMIAKAAPVTFWLAIGAFIMWLAVGISLGIFAALKRGRWPDRLVMGVSLVGYSFPSFFIGLLLYQFVIVQWNLLPPPQYVSPFDKPIQFLQTMIVPWIVLAVLYTAFYMRLTRNQVLEVLNDDYVRTARAKGLPERTVVVKHALRAGLTPIVTAAGLDLAGLLGGAIISETIFSLPGLGNLAVTSVLQSDLPVITGITLLVATIIIFANLVVDLLYAVIDPRVRLA
ncbi:MAG TPA: ABC transporter permease [Candidatus Limnocylindrales bacterium]|nr:ABC transporter permease [Candidatus Limnocylindrales bacterium]